jgi:predicted kinase
LLRDGKDVVYDANLNRRQHRQEKYAICERAGAEPVLVWVQTAKDLARQRATHSERLHLVPKGETLDQMFDRIAEIIEEPGSDEPFVIIDGTNVSDNDVRRLLHIDL